MILQYLSNAGDEGAKRDSIYEYLKDVLPQNKTEEQRLRMLGDLLKAMKMEKLIKTDGRNGFFCEKPSKFDENHILRRKFVEIVSKSS